jgi:GTP:adenosylcobinamide-phosphate guanylyltransferase
MNAILTAGGIPKPGEPLYEYTQGKHKALLEIAGKPMIQWVLDALNASRAVEQIVLVGLDESSGVRSARPLVYLPNQGSMFQNIRAAALRLEELNPGVSHALVVSCDIPAIRGEMVDWLAEYVAARQGDIFYLVIERSRMEQRFPSSRRSYTRLKGLEVCGADLNAFRLSVVNSNIEMWEKLAAARKNVFKQAALIGYGTLLLLLLRRLTLEDAVRRVAGRLGLEGQAVLCPYPEMGMDIDKPFQLELLRHDLAGRGGK